MTLLAILALAAAPASAAPPNGVSLRAYATVEIVRSERASDPPSPERVERQVKRETRGLLIEFS